MIKAITRDMQLEAGIDFKGKFGFLSGGVPFNFTGCKINLTVTNQQYDSPPVLALTTENGKITISADGTSFEYHFEASDTVDYAPSVKFYTLDMVDSSLLKSRIFKGRIRFE